MANICVNTIYFCSKDKEALEAFYKKFRGCYDRLSHNDVYELFLEHGYQEEELRNLIDRRDDLTGCDGILSKLDDYYYFEGETSSAWEPHMDVFYKLLDEKYDNKIRMYYCSEENGCGVYATNDIDGIFFDERYRLDYGYNGKYNVVCFSSLKRMVQYIKTNMREDISELDELSTMEEKIIDAYNTINPDFYCFIHRFEYDYERRVA